AVSCSRRWGPSRCRRSFWSSSPASDLQQFVGANLDHVIEVGTLADHEITKLVGSKCVVGGPTGTIGVRYRGSDVAVLVRCILNVSVIRHMVVCPGGKPGCCLQISASSRPLHQTVGAVVASSQAGQVLLCRLHVAHPSGIEHSLEVDFF